MLVGLLVSVAVTALSRTGVLSGWETRAVDAFLFLREHVPAPEIVLVLIDDDAFLALGQRQPLSRRYVADLADFLLRSGARVVAFDLVVTTPSTPADDQALLDVARRWSGRRPGSLVFASLAMPEAGRGGYALLPAEMRHYALAKTDAIVQVHGMGPFALTYVNPADDPSTRAAAN